VLLRDGVKVHSRKASWVTAEMMVVIMGVMLMMMADVVFFSVGQWLNKESSST
jgi:hypothetical protein